MTAASFWLGALVAIIAMALLNLARRLVANHDRLRLPRAQRVKWATIKRNRLTGTISVRR